MTPAQASIASLSVVLPDDAAKFRRSPAEGVAITQIRLLSRPLIRRGRKLKASARCAGALVGHHAHRAPGIGSIATAGTLAQRASHARMGIRIANFSKNFYTHADEQGRWLTSILLFSQLVRCFPRAGFACRETSG